MTARCDLPADLETDPEKVCELLVGLPDVRILGARQTAAHVELHIETRADVAGCPVCGVVATGKGRRVVWLSDLTCFGMPVRLAWHKRRWRCVEASCPMGSWTEVDERIAGSRLCLTDRAARWACRQVGKFGCSVQEVADTLGCDWHTANDAVIAFGEALLAHPGRFDAVASLGLDEHLFFREGPRRRRCFVTVICDVANGQMLDVVEGRGAAEPLAWLQAQGVEWLAGVETGTLDLSATYRSVFEAATPSATLVADPFHVVRHATSKLDECRRRVQQETLGHRGRKRDALYRARRLLTMAEERLDDEGRAKLLELLGTGDKGGDVTATWHAKEAVRELYAHADEATAADWIDELIEAMAESSTIEVRSLGRTLKNWRDEIIAWHATHVSNGPTEALNNLAKRVKRVAFGFRSFRNYRVRTLLYAGRPDWSALAVIAPLS
jgi:transposase